jgi:hypothetical protein
MPLRCHCRRVYHTEPAGRRRRGSRGDSAGAKAARGLC